MLELCDDLLTSLRGETGEIINILGQFVGLRLLRLQGFTVQVLVERFVLSEDSPSVTFNQSKSGLSPFNLGLDLAEKIC